MGTKNATGFCLWRQCGATKRDTINGNGIPALQTYSVLIAALPVAVYKALILQVPC